jgi:hypothetical protein
VIWLHTDRGHRTVPSVPTAGLVPVGSTEGTTAFPPHMSSHTATGCPVEKEHVDWRAVTDRRVWDACMSATEAEATPRITRHVSQLMRCGEH